MAVTSVLRAWLVYFTLGFVLRTIGAVRQNTYSIVPNAIPAECIDIDDKYVRSILECAMECQNTELCVGAIYAKIIPHSCRLLRRYSSIEARSEGQFFIKMEKEYGELVLHDCAELYKAGYEESGQYIVKIDSTDHFITTSVYCDMETDGGGWTVIQRRQDGSVDFYRDWEAYTNGFGSINGEFWLGNELLHLLTDQKPQQLRVDLRDHEGLTAHAKYSHIYVGSQTEHFALSISGYTGTAGDGLKYHNNHKFTTKDQDNDNNSGNCAISRFGGWWYVSCVSANLNGRYAQTGSHNMTAYARYVTWYRWRGPMYSLKFTEMKIKTI